MNVLQKLTVKTVPKLWKEREELFMSDSVMFAQDASVDSAGIAFLVQWAKHQSTISLLLKMHPKTPCSLLRHSVFRICLTCKSEGLRNLRQAYD